MKRCTTCKVKKKLIEFSKQRTGKEGLFSQCKLCKRGYDTKYYEKNKKRMDERNKGYYIKNKDKFAKKSLKYYHKNSIKMREYHRAYYKKNKKTIFEKHYKKLKEDPQYKVKYSLRKRMQSALKGKNKSTNTVELLGCCIPYLMFYIQNNFKNRMNWNNHGDWHIDHIIPCANFNLIIESEQRKCFHYTNLQPLWAKDNIKKGKNIPKNLKSYKWTKYGWEFNYEQ